MSKFKKAGQWFVTGTLGALTISFAVNAGDILFNHTQPRGQMYAYATSAAICCWLASYFYSTIRSEERVAMNDVLAAVGTGQLLNAGSPAWQDAAMRSRESALVDSTRAERDCPYCAERILVAARLCKHCHSDVIAAAG